MSSPSIGPDARKVATGIVAMSIEGIGVALVLFGVAGLLIRLA